MTKSKVALYAFLLSCAFSGSLAIFNTWLTYSRAPIKPVKEITEQLLYSTDIQSYANRLANFIDFDLKFNGSDVHNVVLFNYSIKNTGNTPITPEDFHKPLKLTFNKDWRILHIENRWKGDGDKPAPDWIKVSTNIYQAEPFLFNNGDSIDLTIYADTQLQNYSDLTIKYGSEPSEFIKVGTRILGVERVIRKSEYERRSFLENKTFFETNILEDGWLGIGTMLFGKRLIAFFIFASLIFYFYLKLIRVSRVVYFRQEVKFNLFYLTAFLLSILGAESLSSMLFPHLIDVISKNFRETLTGNTLNFILLVSSAGPLIFLSIETYHNKQEHPEKRSKRRRGQRGKVAK